MKTIDSLSLSPDGQKLSFRVVSPSLSDNQVHVRWFWIPVRSAHPDAVPLGRTSEPIRLPLFDYIEDGKSQWDSAGRALYVLRRNGGKDAVYRIAPNAQQHLAAAGRADIEDFTLSPGAHSIDAIVRAPRDQIRKAQEREDREGVHFDRSVSALGGALTRNFVVSGDWRSFRFTADGAGEAFAGPQHHIRIPLATRNGPARSVRSASIGAAVLDVGMPHVADEALVSSDRHITLRVQPTDDAQSLLKETTYRLTARFATGGQVECGTSACTGSSGQLRSVAWNEATHEAVIAYEAATSARTALYGWQPETDTLRVIRAADGSLDGGSRDDDAPCVQEDHFYLCVASNPTRAPHLVRIDLNTGDTVTLFDPNSGLAKRHYYPTQFLQWTDAAGNVTTGVLTLPSGQARRWPLVITSYRCRGFLRGGTTALAPEQILAGRGIAALCVNANLTARNAPAPLKVSPDTPPSLPAHESVIASYKAIIDQLDHEGIIDTSRVGLTGHSFSSMVAAYAISHTDLFKTAVIGTGITIDPATFLFTEATRDSYRKGLLPYLGMPNPFDDVEDRWKVISPALNARSIHASLLIQPPENEFHLALQLYAAIQHAGGAVDMYVYPREGHQLTGTPVHQLYREKRSVDWLGFWLLGQKPTGDGAGEELRTWTCLAQHLPSCGP